MTDFFVNFPFQLAPPPTILQNFLYHWKHVKNFYGAEKDVPKVHVNDTHLPGHLDQMLNMVIEEQNVAKGSTTETVPIAESHNECFNFILNNRPFDLLTDICMTDTPPGSSVCILIWMRRFLSCLECPRLDHKSIFQPIQVI